MVGADVVVQVSSDGESTLQSMIGRDMEQSNFLEFVVALRGSDEEDDDALVVQRIKYLLTGIEKWSHVEKITKGDWE